MNELTKLAHLLQF